MSRDIWSVEDLVEDPWKLRDLALRSTWIDWHSEQDGETYQRVVPAVVDAVNDAIAESMGRPITLIASGFRLNYKGEMPNAAIHSDGDGWGKYAMVLYLDPFPPKGNGTQFWEHVATGKDRLSGSDMDGILRMYRDWNSPDQFAPTELSLAKFNKATFYRSEMLHSRHPFEGYGSTPEDGRLTFVAFFS